MKILFLIAAFAFCLASCTKNGSSAPQTFNEFIKNSEWVGTLDRSGNQYAPPCDLKFNANGDSVTCYAIFYFLVNGVLQQEDSVVGKVISIDTIEENTMRIIVNFRYLNSQSLFVYNQKKIMAWPSNNLNQQPTFQLSLFTAKEDAFTGDWGGKPNNYGYTYPDLSYIRLNPVNRTMMHLRNGVSIKLQAGVIGPYLSGDTASIRIRYYQQGAKVWMLGYNEQAQRAVTYFGVLLPTGDSMMVHSNANNSRLPNHINTNQTYGPNGITPIILKQ
jgi:hypothetical protein